MSLTNYDLPTLLSQHELAIQTMANSGIDTTARASITTIQSQLGHNYIDATLAANISGAGLSNMVSWNSAIDNGAILTAIIVYAATNFKSIYIPHGMYYIKTPIYITSFVKIVGENIVNTTFACDVSLTATDTDGFIISHQCELSGFNIYYRQPTVTKSAITLITAVSGNDYGIIRDVNIRGGQSTGGTYLTNGFTILGDTAATTGSKGALCYWTIQNCVITATQKVLYYSMDLTKNWATDCTFQNIRINGLTKMCIDCSGITNETQGMHSGMHFLNWTFQYEPTAGITSEVVNFLGSMCKLDIMFWDYDGATYGHKVAIVNGTYSTDNMFLFRGVYSSTVDFASRYLRIQNEIVTDTNRIYARDERLNNPNISKQINSQVDFASYAGMQDNFFWVADRVGTVSCYNADTSVAMTIDSLTYMFNGDLQKPSLITGCLGLNVAIELDMSAIKLKTLDYTWSNGSHRLRLANLGIAFLHTATRLYETIDFQYYNGSAWTTLLTNSETDTIEQTSYSTPANYSSSINPANIYQAHFGLTEISSSRVRVLIKSAKQDTLSVASIFARNYGWERGGHYIGITGGNVITGNLCVMHSSFGFCQMSQDGTMHKILVANDGSITTTTVL